MIHLAFSSCKSADFHLLELSQCRIIMFLGWIITAVRAEHWYRLIIPLWDNSCTWNSVDWHLERQDGTILETQDNSFICFSKKHLGLHFDSKSKRIGTSVRRFPIWRLSSGLLTFLFIDFNRDLLSLLSLK